MGKKLQQQRTRYRKGRFFEVIRDYCFREGHMGRKSNKPICFTKGDIGKVIDTYVSLGELGIQMHFKGKDGKSGFDDTSPLFVSGKLRRLDLRKPKDRARVKRIYHGEE